MSAYKPGFAALFPAATAYSYTGLIDPSSIDVLEPMVALGEIVFAGDGPDIVMQRTASIPLTVVISMDEST